MLLKDIKKLLLRVQASKGEERELYIQKIQGVIWNDEIIQDEALNDVLTDIAYILDFYEFDDEWRKESPSYYGDEQLEREIKSAIHKIDKAIKSITYTMPPEQN
jgi:hypothetical protein